MLAKSQNKGAFRPFLTIQQFQTFRGFSIPLAKSDDGNIEKEEAWRREGRRKLQNFYQSAWSHLIQWGDAYHLEDPKQFCVDGLGYDEIIDQMCDLIYRLVFKCLPKEKTFKPKIPVVVPNLEGEEEDETIELPSRNDLMETLRKYHSNQKTFNNRKKRKREAVYPEVTKARRTIVVNTGIENFFDLITFLDTSTFFIRYLFSRDFDGIRR